MTLRCEVRSGVSIERHQDKAESDATTGDARVSEERESRSDAEVKG
jgi:hypothetical protein